MTVTGEAPVVDIQSTELTTSFNAELLAAIPTGLARLLVAAGDQPKRAGVEVRRRWKRRDDRAPGERLWITGRAPARRRHHLHLATGGVGFSFYGDYGSFEEVSVSTAGHSAETGSPGLFEPGEQVGRQHVTTARSTRTSTTDAGPQHRRGSDCPRPDGRRESGAS